MRRHGRENVLDQPCRILAIGVEIEPGLFPVVMLLRDQRTASHQRACDAPDERVEQALEFLGRRRRNAMEARVLAVENVHAVEREDVQVDVEIDGRAVSTMRRAPHEGQNPRHLQLNATRCSWWHPVQATRTKPSSSRPQRR